MKPSSALLVPPIKCQGIKTKLVQWIRTSMPSEPYGTWVEPFCGSGAVAFNIRPSRALLADTNPHLISFYQALQSGKITPASVRTHLEREGRLLEESQGSRYYEIRNRFNETPSPLDFLFLNRACFNGMMRFNRQGGFNVPFCKKPQRFAKAYITKVVNQVAAVTKLIQSADYTFLCQPFHETISMAKDEDLIYADPPYMYRNADYFNAWNEEDETRFAHTLLNTTARFMHSTWHHNIHRTNPSLETHWQNLRILTQEHFYHLGGRSQNRKAMVEALIVNF